MKVHPAVHVTWIGALVMYFSRLAFLSDLIEKAYDKTAWLRDLIRWDSKKKRKGKRRTKR